MSNPATTCYGFFLVERSYCNFMSTGGWRSSGRRARGTFAAVTVATDSRTARPYLLRTFFYMAEEVMYYYVKKLMYTCVSTHPVLRDSADRK
jgi:hypothetical protein